MVELWQVECREIQRHKARRIRRETWRKRLYLCLGLSASAYMGLAGYWLWQAGGMNHYVQAAERWMGQRMASAGLVVQRVHISGQRQLKPQAILQQAAIAPNTPLFLLPLEAVRTQLLKHPQIASVELTRELPDRLHIRIDERRPAAIWQHDGRRDWVDREGVRLDAAWVRPHADQNYPVITGAGAKAHMAGLWQMLKHSTELGDRLMAAQWVGDRRWTLWMAEDIRILLPMERPERAFQQLARWHEEVGLLDRAVEQIDLRLEGRAFVRYHSSEEPRSLPSGEMITARLSGDL